MMLSEGPQHRLLPQLHTQREIQGWLDAGWVTKVEETAAEKKSAAEQRVAKKKPAAREANDPVTRPEASPNASSRRRSIQRSGRE